VTGLYLDPPEVRRLVEARLGRQPQDMLEAAVVLEAWAGVPAQGALEAARDVMRHAPAEPLRSTGSLPALQDEEGGLLEALTFLMTVIAIACWAMPLAAGLGVDAVARGLTIALPLTFALQWGLSSRYLGRKRGLEQLSRRRGLLLLSACALPAAGWLLLGRAGMVAALLTISWTAGTILIRRHWAPVYAVLILLATAALTAGLEAVAVLAGVAAASAFSVAAALRPRAGAARRQAGRWDRVGTAAAIGAALGAMLVLDGSVSYTAGAVPALALLPSTLASFWAAHRLRHLGHEIPAAVSGIAVGDPPPRGIESPPLRLLAGTVGGLVVITTGLSAALLLLLTALDSAGDVAGILAGFGLVTLATLLAGLVETLGSGRAALTAVLCAVAAEVALDAYGAPFGGAGLVAGGALAALLLAPVAVALLSRPATTLSTRLWIT
jgi:hypothetical protein